MKNVSRSILALTAVSIGLFSFTAFEGGTIKGTVTPSGSVESVYAISGTDTIKAQVADSLVALEVKPGTYSIQIDAKEPFKDQKVENVLVEEGKTTDLGTITLNQ
ncbi:hypothetical protein [Daejeonella oryzae]|uniref:hypothetical protein n=1 Tax=Daejeonella oryzae TaxID=1122943 RepID=UPI0003FB0345|nr:hypothetical protein [Daejeonella oryzae]